MIKSLNIFIKGNQQSAVYEYIDVNGREEMRDAILSLLGLETRPGQIHKIHNHTVSSHL